MSLVTWAANELVTSAKLNTQVAERPDTCEYGSEVTAREFTSADVGAPVLTLPTAMLRIDTLLGQFLRITYEAKNDTSGGYNVQVRLRTYADAKLWQAIDSGGLSDTDWHLHEHLVDLRLSADGGDCDVDARGLVALVKFNIYHTSGSLSRVKGLQIGAGNIDDLTAYGDRMDITTGTG